MIAAASRPAADRAASQRAVPDMAAAEVAAAEAAWPAPEPGPEVGARWLLRMTKLSSGRRQACATPQTKMPASLVWAIVLAMNRLVRSGEFPAPREAGFPLASVAKRYYQAGVPFLQRYLPFWAANLVDRLWVMLVPIIAVAVPLGRAVPALYRWRTMSMGATV